MKSQPKIQNFHRKYTLQILFLHDFDLTQFLLYKIDKGIPLALSSLLGTLKPLNKSAIF